MKAKSVIAEAKIELTYYFEGGEKVSYLFQADVTDLETNDCGELIMTMSPTTPPPLLSREAIRKMEGR